MAAIAIDLAFAGQRLSADDCKLQQEAAEFGESVEVNVSGILPSSLFATLRDGTTY